LRPVLFYIAIRLKSVYKNQNIQLIRNKKIYIIDNINTYKTKIKTKILTIKQKTVIFYLSYIVIRDDISW